MATYKITLTAIIKGKKYDTEWTNLSINKFNKRCELYSFRAPIFILKFQQMQQHHPYLLYCQKLYSNVTAKNLATCTHVPLSPLHVVITRCHIKGLGPTMSLFTISAWCPESESILIFTNPSLDWPEIRFTDSICLNFSNSVLDSSNSASFH